MAIDATTGSTSALTAATTTSTENPNGVLGKDDFMQLLLTELQYQDPTEPTDTETILTQTSQLASLESADNTNAALEKLTASLGSSQQFSTISAIGKTADLGSDAIAHDKDTETTFEVYFPNDVEQGVVSITDANGQTVKTLDVGTNPAGVYQFTWDGTDSSGNQVDSAIYHVNAEYTDANGDTQQTRLGAYPIESVRFDGDNTYLKVGSNYVSLENIVEVY
ncbi:FlgD immunoglobulin-like domain containing protein [Sulfurimonas sp.]